MHIRACSAWNAISDPCLVAQHGLDPATRLVRVQVKVIEVFGDIVRDRALSSADWISLVAVRAEDPSEAVHAGKTVASTCVI